jgi:GDP-L-fucose synthase
METILVTGGYGLVGCALQKISTKYTKYKFIFMSSKDCDLINWNQTISYFNKIKPEYVIHLAACVGGLFKNMKCKVDMLEKNIFINSNVLKACHQLKVKKLISCLSTCIFPDKINYPINESMLHDGPPHNSNDAYAYAKRLLEIHSKSYQEQYNNNFICVIPTNIYGPNDNFNLNNGHVIPSLIHKCYIAKQNKEPFVICGSGNPLRQFIYSEDLADLFMKILEIYDDKSSIILSVNEKDEVSIRDIALSIADKFDYKNIIFDKSKPDGQYKKTADNTKLLKLIGDYDFTTINNGLSKTIDWFVSNYDNCRK